MNKADAAKVKVGDILWFLPRLYRLPVGVKVKTVRSYDDSSSLEYSTTLVGCTYIRKRRDNNSINICLGNSYVYTDRTKALESLVLDLRLDEAEYTRSLETLKRETAATVRRLEKSLEKKRLKLGNARVALMNSKRRG